MGRVGHSTDSRRGHVHRERAPRPLGSQLVLGYSIIHRKETEQPGWFLGDLRSGAGVVPAGLPAPQVDRGAWQDPPSWTRIFLAESGEEARDGEACCAGASGELMCPSANCPNLSTTFSSGLTRRRCARAPAATTPCAAARWRN